ncbi:leucyl aminopeptidase [Fusibacter tunisiensis]|uniref:Probable cytosol aminopeptidase n=1 Tax=Fusibacter tunisiensis TaxID=1008308 RepID=A0ABS2MRH5_9FIRM|nr:leucyl aminopeptidase [Fusibacter tunisiensis]MBM7561990.1 leucyl aminopeptidase [Fusibacter tunisiensis]
MEFKFNEKWDATLLEGIIVMVDESCERPDYDQALLDHISKKEIFSGKIGETYASALKMNSGLKEIVFVGIGTAETFKKEKWVKALAGAFKQLKKKKVTNLGVDLTPLKNVFDQERVVSRLISESLILSDYKFDDYLSERKDSTVASVYFKGLHLRDSALEEGQVLGEATLFARKLTNMPANILTPTKLAEMTVDYGQKSGFEVEIKDVESIQDLKMEAYLSVAKGSSEAPQLIVMRYTGNPKSSQRLGLVGKGLTYDSGGLSIKPTNGMVTMKDDMSGASAVIGTMGAIAQMKLPVNVTAVVAACENMISGHSYKPGDIISSMAGKSIFIGNTDAEGRLTLVDAVTYIQKHEEVDKVVDIATLTGAAVASLGTEASAIISTDDTFYTLVEKAFEKALENQWRLPIFDAYREKLKHEEADLNNSAGTPGAITAGLFIEAFVEDKPWVHIDIAGTAFKEKEDGIYSKGGTGAGVRPLYFLAKKLSK